MKKILFTILLCFICSTVSADEYYLGRWVWNDDDANFPYWEAPHKNILTGTIDLRSIPNMSEKGGTPQGYGIFSYSETVSDINLIHIGNEKGLSTARGRKDQLANTLGITINSTNAKDLIYELLTIRADPTGQTRWKPAMPDKNMDIKVRLGRDGVLKQSKLVPFESPEWENVLAVLHEDYKKQLNEYPYSVIAKVLDFNEEKYGIDYRYFIPKDASIRIASLPHETTITESFNTGDSDTLGPDLTWTEVDGDIDVVSNEAKSLTTTTNHLARAETDLSSSDHYAQIDLTTVSGTSKQSRIAVRFNSSAETCYFHIIFTNNLYRIYKSIAGSLTQLSTASDTFPGAPITNKIQIDGSDLTAYEDDVEKTSVTDTAITGNLRTGFGSNGVLSSTIIHDNFEASDLAAAEASFTTLN